MAGCTASVCGNDRALGHRAQLLDAAIQRQHIALAGCEPLAHAARLRTRHQPLTHAGPDVVDLEFHGQGVASEGQPWVINLMVA